MTQAQKLRHSVQEQTQITELTIMPDGRVYVFGTSRKILEVLESLGPKDVKLKHLLKHVRQLERGA